MTKVNALGSEVVQTLCQLSSLIDLGQIFTTGVARREPRGHDPPKSVKIIKEI